MAWLNAKFGALTAWDVLGLGLSGGELFLLYAGVLVILIVLLVVFVSICRSEKHRLNRWRKQRPSNQELLVQWLIADEESRNTIGELSRTENWCRELLPEIGQDENAASLFFSWWPYQGELQPELLKALVESIADLRLEQSMAATAMLKQLADERALPLLSLALLKSETYPPARICEILPVYERISARVLVALYQKLEVDEEDKKYLLLEAMGALGTAAPKEFLLRLSSGDDAELAKRANRALAAAAALETAAFEESETDDEAEETI